MFLIINLIPILKTAGPFQVRLLNIPRSRQLKLQTFLINGRKPNLLGLDDKKQNKTGPQSLVNGTLCTLFVCNSQKCYKKHGQNHRHI